VLEIVAMLLSLQLIAGRNEIWMPQRWRRVRLEGGAQTKFIEGLIKYTRKMERFSRPRFTFLFEHRITDIAFGFTVLGLTIAAFVAPPFTGLDTLPALGVVVLSVGVIMEDFLFVIAGVVVGLIGALLEITLGGAIFKGVEHIF
jgi:hypothetical protein